MSILIINASPRKSGNSTFIAESLKEKYGDSCQVVNLAELNMKPCTSCRSCKINNSFCVIKDDISELYSKLLSADKIILISPNIMGFISSHAKILTDRFYCLKTSERKTKFEEGKKMFFILTQKSADRSHGNMAANWAKGFFEQYGLKTFTFVIPNCGYDNTDGVKIKLDEIKMNVSMFFN
ncbi:flavodoxin family protein [Mucispirillum schaedleri]|uniref:flavodoxin family protein n=1 Tax=Mucispirillum schaedleri TaxID=248039 RepID=UPI001F5A6220|nr:flavodoxin family protein [Mucispirillum schaedleri]